MWATVLSPLVTNQERPLIRSMKTFQSRRRCLAGHQQRSSRSGFSLIEVVIASGILLMGLMALTSTSVVVHNLDQNDDTRRLASSALRGAVDRIHSVSANAIDDEDGWATTVSQAFAAGNMPGPVFTVEGLDPWDGMASVGTVQLVTDETLTDELLGSTLGMPRDLNNDGLTDNTDVSADARLLPVVVSVRWQTASGQRQLRQGFYVVGM